VLSDFGVKAFDAFVARIVSRRIAEIPIISFLGGFFFTLELFQPDRIAVWFEKIRNNVKEFFHY
jgi:hypothetical protein